MCRSRPASESVHVLREVFERAGKSREGKHSPSGKICSETGETFGGGNGSDRQHLDVLSGAEKVCRQAGSGEPESVQSNQPFCKENRQERCENIGRVSGKGSAAGGENDELQSKVASLTQTREKLVQLRTVLKNKINNLFASRFILLKREELSSEKGLQKVLTYHFDSISDVELRVMVDQIRSLNKSIEELDKAIEDNGTKMDGFDNLKSVKGIGAKGTATLLSVIGNINDFRSAKQLAAYIGIVPRVSDSNETVHHGRITKQGSKIARTTLVQCALIAKRYNAYLFNFHEGIKARRGGAKANIALARKFLEIIYRILKNKWIFEDFTQFKLKTA